MEKQRKEGRMTKANKTPAQLDEDMFGELLSHISKGFSRQSFGKLTSSGRNSLLDRVVGGKERIELAENGGQLIWESIGLAQARGTCIGNSNAWRFAMSARYGWSDRVRVDTTTAQSINVQVVHYNKPAPAPALDAPGPGPAALGFDGQNKTISYDPSSELGYNQLVNDNMEVR